MAAQEVVRILKFLLGTPIGPRGFTLAGILKGRLTKAVIRKQFGMEHKKSSEPHPALLKLSLINAIAKMSSIEKEAPFKSEAQRRLFYAKASRGEISRSKVREWERETPDKKLPERIHEKSGIAQYLPWLTMVPGKGLARVARGVGWASIPAAAGIEGMKKPPPSNQRVAFVADMLIGLTKESTMFQSLSSRATAHFGKKVGGKTVGEAPPVGRKESGPAGVESPEKATGGGGSHIARPSI